MDDWPFGFKQLDQENWRGADEVSSAFVGRLDWPNVVLRYKLGPKVPIDVRKLFEVAKGCIVYGANFYPLFTLGSEQLHRVIDAALLWKLKELDVEAEGKGMAWRIKQFEQRGMLDEKSVRLLDSVRQLRNWSSHPSHQTILMPGHTLRAIERTMDFVNSLFGETYEGARFPSRAEQSLELVRELNRSDQDSAGGAP